MEKELAIAAVIAELDQATAKFGGALSAHEAYAIILEEVDELWADIKANLPVNARFEAIQVAAMAIRFLIDIDAGPWDADAFAAAKAIR